MDELRKLFPFVPSEDLASALGYADGDIQLATVIVQSALDVQVQPQWGKVRVLGNVDKGKGHEAKGGNDIQGRRTPRPYSFTRSISEPTTSTISGTVNGARPSLAQRNESSTSLPQTKTSALPGSYTPPSSTTDRDADEDTIECQCCFDNFFVDEVTCCSADLPHLFCFACAKRYAEGEIGKTKFELVCLDGSGCKAPFEESEIRRFLDEKAFKLLDKLRTANELKEAGLEGLVHCPFCSFAAIMEDPTDRIFDCEGCGVKSCRYCRVKSHHPLSCEKYNKEKHLSSKHQVEEAMTNALLRKCNNCQKPFLKEGGCNKMRCSCGNTQCFLCSANVHDYTHFDQRDQYGRKLGCSLYGDTKNILKREVQEAQDKAVREILKEKGSEVEEEDVRVDKEVEVPNTDGPGMPPGFGGLAGFGGLPMPFGPPGVFPLEAYGMGGMQQRFMNLGNAFAQQAIPPIPPPAPAPPHPFLNNPFHNPYGVFPPPIPAMNPFAPWQPQPAQPQAAAPLAQQPQQQQQQQQQQQPRQNNNPGGNLFWNHDWPLPFGQGNQPQRAAPINLQAPARQAPQPAATPNNNQRTRQDVPRSARNAPRTPHDRNRNEAPPQPPNTPRNNPPTPGPRVDLAPERRAPRTPTWLQGLNNNQEGHVLMNPYGGFGRRANNNGRGENGPRTAPLPNTGRRLGDQELGEQM